MKEIIEPKYHISFSELEEKLGIEKNTIAKIQVTDKNLKPEWGAGRLIIICKGVEKDV